MIAMEILHILCAMMNNLRWKMSSKVRTHNTNWTIKVYDIEVIKKPAEKNINSDKKIEYLNVKNRKIPKESAVIDIVVGKNIFKSTWQLGHLSLPRINRYVEIILIVELKNILENHPDYDVDTNAVGGDNQGLFLVRKKVKDVNWARLCEFFNIQRIFCLSVFIRDDAPKG